MIMNPSKSRLPNEVDSGRTGTSIVRTELVEPARTRRVSKSGPNLPLTESGPSVTGARSVIDRLDTRNGLRFVRKRTLSSDSGVTDVRVALVDLRGVVPGVDVVSKRQGST